MQHKLNWLGINSANQPRAQYALQQVIQAEQACLQCTDHILYQLLQRARSINNPYTGQL